MPCHSTLQVPQGLMEVMGSTSKRDELRLMASKVIKHSEHPEDTFHLSLCQPFTGRHWD